MKSSSSQFDIVVYGATGFTGQLIAEYLAAHYSGTGGPKWAMAGRNLEKLASVRDVIGAPSDIALIQADASDPASLKTMADQTKSVLSTVGPYQLYGSELLAICAATGTDYLDLCGEPVWMRQMIDAHEADDKIIGVLENDYIWGNAHDIGDVPSVLVERLQHYVLTYKLIPDKLSEATVAKIYGREHAFEVVRAAMADYVDKFR